MSEHDENGTEAAKAAAAAGAEMNETDELDEAEGATADAPVDELSKLRAELEAARAQARERHNDMLRTAADFDNYRKRIARDSVRDRELAEEKVIKKVLPVLDNLERGLAHMTPTTPLEKIKEGTDATLRQFLAAMQDLGVSQMEALGKVFDPKLHDAISQVVDPEKPENTVVAVAEPGYMIKDRVLRHAKVVVSKPA